MEYNIKNRIGETKIMTCGEEATIIEYIDALNVKIMFKKFKDIYKCTYQQFKNGQVKSKLFPSMYNMGFIGLGEYKVSENSIHTIQYIYWEGMMRRCFGKKLKEKHHTMIIVHVVKNG